MTLTIDTKLLSDPVKTTYARLGDLIRMDIVSGELQPGSRVKVAALASRYKTSAIPVREALHRLQGEGLIQFSPNRGASVRAIDSNFIRDIHEIRALVEPFLVRWFVRHHREQDLARLEAAQREYDTAVLEGRLELTHQLNRRFHDICYSGHYNGEALQVAYRHTDLIGTLFARFPRSKARSQAISREHWQIIEAIRAQDEELTARLMHDHVRSAGQHLIETIDGAARQSRPPE